jgi:hypothetical protein
MKAVAIAFALCFAALAAQAATKTPVNKYHHTVKHSKIKTRSNVKRAPKASSLKKLNRNRVN